MPVILQVPHFVELFLGDARFLHALHKRKLRLVEIALGTNDVQESVRRAQVEHLGNLEAFVLVWREVNAETFKRLAGVDLLVRHPLELEDEHHQIPRVGYGLDLLLRVGRYLQKTTTGGRFRPMRKPKLTYRMVEQAVEMKSHGMSNADICRGLGVSETAWYK